MRQVHGRTKTQGSIVAPDGNERQFEWYYLENTICLETSAQDIICRLVPDFSAKDFIFRLFHDS